MRIRFKHVSSTLLLCMIGICLGGCTYSYTWVEGKHIAKCESSEILDAAWEAYNRRDYEEAAHLAGYIPQFHPDSFDAEEAYFLAGESCFEEEEYWLSFRFYRDLLTRFPVSQFIDEVAEKDYLIGEAYLDQEPGFFGHLFTNRGRGVRVMNHLVTNFSRHALADDALMAMGDYYFGNEEYVDAAFNYTQLIKLYQGSEWCEKALYRLGESYFYDSKGISYDRDHPLKAWKCMEAYIKRYPRGNHVDTAEDLLAASQEHLALKELEIADYYWNQDCDLGRRIHLSNILLIFPDTKACSKAREIMDDHKWDTSLNSADKMVPTESMRFLY